MSYEQRWEIGGVKLPSATCGLDFSHATPHGPYQLAYICPVCGDVWARRFIIPATRWMALHRACSKCPGELFIKPGSVVQSWDRNFVANMPRELLERELQLGAEHANHSTTDNVV